MTVRSCSTERTQRPSLQNGSPQSHPEVSPLLSALVTVLLLNVPTLRAVLVRAVPGIRPNAPRRNALVVLCYLVFVLIAIGMALW